MLESGNHNYWNALGVISMSKGNVKLVNNSSYTIWWIELIGWPVYIWLNNKQHPVTIFIYFF